MIRSNVIHLMRGETYVIDGKRLFVMGGGVSIDKALRKSGISWWEQEMPSDEEYKKASENLKRYDYKVDYILTHTAPDSTVEYLLRSGKGMKSTLAEEFPLNGFLKWVEEKVGYKKWYFGHFHVDMELWKNQYAVFEGIRELESGRLVKKRND